MSDADAQVELVERLLDRAHQPQRDRRFALRELVAMHEHEHARAGARFEPLQPGQGAQGVAAALQRGDAAVAGGNVPVTAMVDAGRVTAPLSVPNTLNVSIALRPFLNSSWENGPPISS